jgi:hypothetical protein
MKRFPIEEEVYPQIARFRREEKLPRIFRKNGVNSLISSFAGRYQAAKKSEGSVFASGGCDAKLKIKELTPFKEKENEIINSANASTMRQQL